MCVVDTHYKLCGGLGGKGSAPREVTSQNVAFVNDLYHILVSRASREVFPTKHLRCGRPNPVA